MDKVTLVFISLLLILLLSQFLRVESFVDLSDNSGVKISLTLSDLIKLISLSKGTSQNTPITSSIPEQSVDSQFYSTLKPQILSDVRESVSKELNDSPLTKDTSCGTISDECINSFVSKQSADFMRYIPGKNPSDYIRKDSIPCYACNIP